MILKITIIAIMLINTAVSLLLQFGEKKSVSNPTPQSVADVYDGETYKKWKAYGYEKNSNAIISTVVFGIINLILLVANGHSALASVFPDSVYMQILAIVLLEGVLDAVIGTVFAYIDVMKTEQKFGFNRTTLKTFVFDRVKSFLFGSTLAFFICALIKTIHSASNFFLTAATIIVAIAVFMVVSNLLSPFLLRLSTGNKLTPLEDGPLKERLTQMVLSHGYKLRGIKVMNASRRSTKLNAMFAGIGKSKTVILYDTLIEAMSEDEICAVFAHELGHGIHKDVPKRQFFSILTVVIILALAVLAVSVPGFYTQFGFESINYGFAYVLTGVFMSFIQIPIFMLNNAISRKGEFRADAQAVKEGYGKAMVSALKTLARENFAHLSPSKINVLISYSHPPLNQRIEAVERELEKVS